MFHHILAVIVQYNWILIGHLPIPTVGTWSSFPVHPLILFFIFLLYPSNNNLSNSNIPQKETKTKKIESKKKW